MPAPVLSAYTMRRGALTLAGAGGVPLGQFMQTGGDVATGWAIVSGNTGSALAINATTGAVTPVASGGFGSGTWTLGIQATNASGTSNTATLTITTAASTYTVATPADVDTGLRSTTGVRAGLGGKTVEIARGAEAAFANQTLLQWRAFNTHTGRFTIRDEDAANRTTLTKCWFYGLQRCDVLGLKTSYGIDAVYDDTGLTGSALTSYQSARQALQGVFQVMLIYNASNGICSDVVIDGLQVGADASYTDPVSWISGLSTIGGGAGNEHQNITVRNYTARRVKDGHNWGAVTNYLFELNTIDRFCSNGNFAGTGVVTDAILQDFSVTRPMFNPADPGDHPDFCQIGGSLATADWYRIKVRRFSFLTLDGTGLAQGPFTNDLGYNGAASNTGTIVISNGQRLTGFQFHDCEFSSGLYDGGTLGITFDIGDGWLVERVTVVRGKLTATQLKAGAQYSDPYFRADLLTQTGAGGGTAGVPVIPFGIIRNSVTHFQPAANSGFTQTNNTYMGASGLPTGSTATNTTNEAARVAFLSTWFQDPGNDDPTLAYRPILNGALKNADGSYRGALLPNGARNTGAIYSGGITMATLAYNSFVRDVFTGAIDCDSDTFKAMLTTSAYTENKDTHTKRSDVTNEVTGTGYTAGGAACTVTVALDLTTDRVTVTLGAVSWSTATITARKLVVYKSRGGASSADELVAVIDFGSDVTSTAGTFSVTASTVTIQN